MVTLLVFLVPLLMFFSQAFHGFERGVVGTDWTLDTFVRFARDPYYWQIVWNSVVLGLLVTGVTLALAYPLALVMTPVRGTPLFVVIAIVVFSPLLTSVIVRSYGWMYILSDSGVLNWLLTALGIVDDPVRMIYNWIGVVVAMVHLQMPFMLFPIMTSLMRLPPRVQDAAQDLGAGEMTVWWRVVRPLSLPGVLAGSQLVFATSISAFATPVILGGGRVQVLPTAIYSSIQGLNWPMGGVQAITLLALSTLLTLIFTRLLRTRSVAAKGGAA